MVLLEFGFDNLVEDLVYLLFPILGCNYFASAPQINAFIMINNGGLIDRLPVPGMLLLPYISLDWRLLCLSHAVGAIGTREIVVNQISPKAPMPAAEEIFSVEKAFHEFLQENNVAMHGPMEGDDNPMTLEFFRNTKGKSFNYG